MSATDRTLLWAFEGPAVPGPVIDRARQGRITGITLFRHHNVQTPSQVRDLTAELGAAVDGPPPLVAIDQEAGQFRALVGSTAFAGNLALGAVDDVALTTTVATAIGTELRAVGVNTDYAPVADIITQPSNPSLGVRSFGGDPAAVARHVGAFVSGLAGAGVLSVVKHFPGKGEATVDPHFGLPVLDLDRSRLDEIELLPFRTAIEAGADAVMTGHYALPRITGRNDLPATVSSEIVQGIIRNDLAFDGLVITDALDMAALDQEAGSIIEALSAVRAGVDLLLCAAGNDQSERLAAGIGLAERRGLLSDRRLADSIRRSTAARERIERTPTPDFDVVGCEEHRRLADELARRSITLVRDRDGLLPIAADKRVVCIVVEPVDLTPADTSSLEPARLGRALGAHVNLIQEVRVNHRPTGQQTQAAIAAAVDADIVVVGTITTTPEQAALVRSLCEVAPVAVAALRTPFDLDSFPELGTYLCTYSVLEPSLDALAAALAGASPIEGRLPVAVSADYPVGHGLQR